MRGDIIHPLPQLQLASSERSSDEASRGEKEDKELEDSSLAFSRAPTDLHFMNWPIAKLGLVVLEGVNKNGSPDTVLY